MSELESSATTPPAGAVPEPVSPLPLTLGELAAAVRFVARERPGAIEMLLWALCRSPEMVEVCRESEPAAHEYADVAGLDGIVNALLTASEEGRDLLAAGLRSSPSSAELKLQVQSLTIQVQSMTAVLVRLGFVTRKQLKIAAEHYVEDFEFPANDETGVPGW